MTRSSSWTQGQAALTYRIGECTLFERDYRALICTTPYTQLRTDLEGFSLPFDQWPPGIDVLKIPSCPLSVAFPRLHTYQRTLCYVTYRYNRFIVELNACEFADYLGKKFSSKTRSTLRRKIRKLEDHCGGTCNLRAYRTQDELREFFDLASTVSAKSYQERLLGKGLPTDREFINSAAENAKRDAVRGYLLFSGPSPISYMYCSIDRTAMLYESVGYDPAYAKFSVGTILHYLVLEQLFSEKIVEIFDFTEGEGEHKQFWATTSVSCGDVLLFRPSLSMSVVVGLHRGYERVHTTAVQLLAQLGLKRRIKVWLRASAR